MSPASNHEHLLRSNLEQACQRQGYCRCGQPLDTRRAVQLDLIRAEGGAIFTKVLCTPCWDRMGSQMISILQPEILPYATMDGRVLWRQRQ